MSRLRAVVLLTAAMLATACAAPRGTGDLGVVIERADGSVVVDTTARERIAGVPSCKYNVHNKITRSAGTSH